MVMVAATGMKPVKFANPTEIAKRIPRESNRRSVYTDDHTKGFDIKLEITDSK